MGNSKGSADKVVGDGPLRTEFYLCPNDDPELVVTVNMPLVPGSTSVSVVWTVGIRWVFVLERNDPHVVVALTVDAISGKTVQSITQYPRSNRHREDMKRFLEDLALLRKAPKQKEGKKDGRGSKQSDSTQEVPGGDSRVPSGDNEGGDGPGEAEVPAVD